MLTCPIIFKAVEKMEDHHGQRMEGGECNVHLDLKKMTMKNSLLDIDSPSFVHLY